MCDCARVCLCVCVNPALGPLSLLNLCIDIIHVYGQFSAIISSNIASTPFFITFMIQLSIDIGIPYHILHIFSVLCMLFLLKSILLFIIFILKKNHAQLLCSET